MTAVDHAAAMIRSGRSPALAVYLAAESHAVSTRDVSHGLAQRRRSLKHQIVTRRAVRRWWED